jgi:hypothetical protein
MICLDTAVTRRSGSYRYDDQEKGWGGERVGVAPKSGAHSTARVTNMYLLTENVTATGGIGAEQKRVRCVADGDVVVGIEPVINVSAPYSG